MRPAVPQHVVFRRFVDETVVLNLETGQYHGLNRTGGRMLELLADTGDLDEVARRLSVESGEPEERIGRDLREFCSDLAHRGLLELGGPSG